MEYYPTHHKFPEDLANRDYFVFEKFPDGSAVWRDCAFEMENVELKVRELTRGSKNKFFAINLRDRIQPVIRPLKSRARPALRRTLRILIADDHELMRAGIRTILSNDPRWKICGEAENGREAVAKTRELQPDLVILDRSMLELNGIEAACEIRRIAPATQIIIHAVQGNRSTGFGISTNLC